MIARFIILLPFDLYVTEDNGWTTIAGSTSEFEFRIYTPAHYAHRPRPEDTVHTHITSWATNLTAAQFSDDLLLNGKKLAPVNVLVIDLIKAEFDRSIDFVINDPLPTQVFDLANAVLVRIRVFSRTPQIQPLLQSRDPWRLQYLTDEAEELPEEEGLSRGKLFAPVTIGVPTIALGTLEMLVQNQASEEPYVWDQLLLDGKGLWPDIGSSIVMTYAALETFIEWALETLEREQRTFSNVFWEWLKGRDHWSKEPSVAEQFDSLLLVFTGRSLKHEPSLWQSFTELKKARNSLVHHGAAKVDGKSVDAPKAKELIDAADKIVGWVELLLPEKYRRRATDPQGLFQHRMASESEAAVLGPARVAEGQLGALAAGASVRLQFDRHVAN